MLKKKESIIVIYTITALLLDLAGRYAADRLMLPVWLDSIGTFLIAYAAGPVCGAVVGLTNNIIYGIFVDQQSVYCIVGALLGAAVGYYAKKGAFDTQFRTMSLGMGLALLSTFCAVILNTVLYDGMTGNVWGNQMMLFCIDNGFPKYISYIIGQFSVEFLDKLLTAEFIYLMRKAVRFRRRKKQRPAGADTVSGVSTVTAACRVTDSSAAAVRDRSDVKAEDKNKDTAAGRAAYTALVLISAFIFGITHAGSIEAQAAETKHDYDTYLQTVYAGDQGLLPGEANDIAQTKDGRLWIGTYAGLFKYNGSRFTLIQDVPSVKNVNCLYVDEEGRLWAGTNDDGVSVFINDHVMNVIDEDSGLLSNTVKSIVCDASGNYYIGTARGLSVVSLSGGVRVTKSRDDIKNIIAMTADSTGHVAAVTGSGTLYHLYDGEIISEESRDYGSKYKTACFTEDGRFITADSENVLRIYRMRGGKPNLISEISAEGTENINSLHEAENGDIFICSDTGAAVLGTDGNISRINTGDFNSSIDNMLIDYQDNLWFCSSRLGLLELSESAFDELFSNIGENDVVNAAEIYDGQLFCGTDNGLVVIDEESSSKKENDLTKLLDDVRIRDLMTDSCGNLWIASAGMGLYRVHGGENKGYAVRCFDEDDNMPGMRFRNVLELSDGRTAAAGDYGTAIIDGEKLAAAFTEENGLINAKSLCMLEYKGALYIGSDGGGIAKIANDEIVSVIGRKDGLSSEVVMRMVYDPDSDGVFIVTSNGLCYMYPDGQIKKLENFPYSNNYDIIINDDKSAWVLGSAGIYIADTGDLIADNKNDYPLINSKRGLRSSLTANAWTCRNGDELYLCCGSGVVRVNTGDYDMSAKSYRMVMDYVSVDGERFDIDRADSFVMAAEADTIVFEPEILNYTVNDPYVSIFLDGYDKSESVCPLSELTARSYTGLKSGNYVFRISILDGPDGRAAEYGSYNIVKETEMYQQKWFRLYVVLISGLVLVWITWFVTRTRAQKILLKQRYELEYARKQIRMGNETILSIARTVDAKDSNTSQHSFRVSEYAAAIAKKLGYSEEKCENLRQIALMHDIGKIGIPDAILNKPGRLTDEEYEIMKTHVLKGGEILKDFTMIENVSLGAMYHHERYDGKGYCCGLKGEEIPLDARIIGIADAFDAMTANRVYRRKLSMETVIGELEKGRGTQFDPKLVDILLSLIEDGTIDTERMYAREEK